jgi:ribosomal protein L17
MKILITEKQLSILTEETDGLDFFMDYLIDTHPNVNEFRKVVEDFIRDSGCNKIEIRNLNSAGLSLHDKVIINSSVFSRDLNEIMYVIFHEIAHQYQYKKYGRDKIYNLYLGELNLDDAIKFLKFVETVADQFAIRKCRELHKLGLLDRVGLVKKGFYENIWNQHLFKKIIQDLRNLMKKNNITKPEEVSETIYNFLINKINE